MKLSQTTIDKIIKARKAGFTQKEIATALNITQACVSMYLKANGMSGTRKSAKLDINSL